MTLRIFSSFLFISLLFLACTEDKQKRLPIYGEREVVEKDGKTDTIYHSIRDFTLLNQDSAEISNQYFDGKIYVANFFFTNCPTICPVTQQNLKRVYEEFKNDDRINFVSHSVDFKYDSPAVLKEYAEKLGVSGNQWQFLSGSKRDIYQLSDDYLTLVQEDENAPGGYEHQEYFILIDPDRQIRGAYNGTDMFQIKELIKDIPILMEEYK